jgi:gamma-glutamyltranspeptidase
VAKKRPAVCTTYRAYWVCGMGPPSSGGITVAQSLGILENFNLELFPPTAVDKEGGKPDVFGVHLISESERLAYADRDKYIADTDFVSLPGGTWNTMLNKPYLRSRADLISFSRSMGTAQPGDLGAVPLGVVPTPENGTTQVTIVDKNGNVVTFTTTVESSFGSFHMTRGFMLNNQLTDFSATPTDAAGVAGGQPRAAAQAPAQLDGADAGVPQGGRRRHGRLRDGHRLTRRRDDHPVRREDAGGHAGLEAGRAAGDGHGGLRRGELDDHQCRRRDTRASMPPTTATAIRW